MSIIFNLTYSILYLIVTVAMVVFVLFGFWSLRERFVKHKEFGLRTQGAVLFAVVVFYVFEMKALRILLPHDPVYFIFSFLGLVIAGFALYGTMLVSFLSRLLVETVVPEDPVGKHIPRLGAAEAREKAEDWEGALNEYYVAAQIYPGNTLIQARVARVLVRLERADDAIAWFSDGLAGMQSPEEVLVLLRRILDLCQRQQKLEEARDLLHLFMTRFPEFEASVLGKQFLEEHRAAVPLSAPGGESELQSLESHPLGEDAAVASHEQGGSDTLLEAMEDDWSPHAS
ncbi:MAG: tetratricopeptide repeat protein [Candidatus Hydrogenedentes bacterium]|jgi:hypothetical protein|nr:tetratricopeptide repeat protein [Candidatus Hydrogenedentota bacterium]